ncbi:MAG: 5-formyltetrahydrofolate cyclo-ligase [Candidatus Omnitrophota bacterium]|nr:5-formyltetrahydrofolate cyclo-ligase [Candidatus Omnitrophota bacterium]
MENRLPLIIRIISAIIVAAFFAQDIAWAYPADKLAPQSFFNTPGSRESASGLLIEHLIEKDSAFHSNILLPTMAHILESKAIKKYLIDNKITYDCEKTSDGQISDILIKLSSGYILRYYDPQLSRPDKYPSSVESESPLTYISKQVLKAASDPGSAHDASIPGSETAARRSASGVSEGGISDGKEKLLTGINKQMDRLIKAIPNIDYRLANKIKDVKRLINTIDFANVQLARNTLLNIKRAVTADGRQLPGNRLYVQQTRDRVSKRLPEIITVVEDLYSILERELEADSYVPDEELPPEILELPFDDSDEFRLTSPRDSIRQSASGGANKQDEKIRLSKEIEYLTNKYNFGKAKMLARQCMNRYPDDPYFPYLLIKACVRSNEFQDAIQTGEKAIKKFPDNPIICNALANAYIKTGQPEKAISLCRETINRSPDDPVAYNILATAYVYMGRLIDAVIECKKTIKKFPRDPVACNIQTNAYIRAGRPEHAIFLGEETVRKFPKDPVAYDTLIRAYIHAGQPENASSRVTEALEKFHDSPLRKFWLKVTSDPKSFTPDVRRSASGAADIAKLKRKMRGEILKELKAKSAEDKPNIIIYWLRHPPYAVTNPASVTSWRDAGYAAFLSEARRVFGNWHNALAAAGIEKAAKDFKTKPPWEEKYADWGIVNTIVRNRVGRNCKARRITHEETVALAREVQKGNGAAREAMAQAYHYLIVEIAEHIQDSNPDINLKPYHEDLMSVGLYGNIKADDEVPGGLLRAIDLYEPSNDLVGYRFKFDAHKRIKKAMREMVEEIRKDNLIKDTLQNAPEDLISDRLFVPESSMIEKASRPSDEEILDSMKRAGVTSHDQRIVMAYRSGETQTAIGKEIGGISGRPVKGERIRQIINRVNQKITAAENRREEELLPPLERLTDREKEIIELIFEGHTYHGIAILLGCGDNKIKKSIYRLYKLLNVDNTIKLLQKLIEVGYKTALPETDIDMSLMPQEERALALLLDGKTVEETVSAFGAGTEIVSYVIMKHIYDKWSLIRTKDKYMIALFLEAVKKGYIIIEPVLPGKEAYRFQKFTVKFNGRFNNGAEALTSVPKNDARRSASGKDKDMKRPEQNIEKHPTVYTNEELVKAFKPKFGIDITDEENAKALKRYRSEHSGFKPTVDQLVAQILSDRTRSKTLDEARIRTEYERALGLVRAGKPEEVIEKYGPLSILRGKYGSYASAQQYIRDLGHMIPKLSVVYKRDLFISRVRRAVEKLGDQATQTTVAAELGYAHSASLINRARGLEVSLERLGVRKGKGGSPKGSIPYNKKWIKTALKEEIKRLYKEDPKFDFSYQGLKESGHGYVYYAAIRALGSDKKPWIEVLRWALGEDAVANHPEWNRRGTQRQKTDIPKDGTRRSASGTTIRQQVIDIGTLWDHVISLNFLLEIAAWDIIEEKSSDREVEAIIQKIKDASYEISSHLFDIGWKQDAVDMSEEETSGLDYFDLTSVKESQKRRFEQFNSCIVEIVKAVKELSQDKFSSHAEGEIKEMVSLADELVVKWDMIGAFFDKAGIMATGDDSESGLRRSASGAGETEQLKRDIRRDILDSLKAQPTGIMRRKSVKIAQRLFSTNSYSNAKAIFIYVSKEEEVDTFRIIEKALKDGKAVFVPRMIGETGMDAVQIRQIEGLVKGRFGMLEPMPGLKAEKDARIDLMILPLVGFDRNCNRLGRGGGYFDRFLAEFAEKERGKAVPVIGLAYDLQYRESLPVLENDMPLDRIFTETRHLVNPDTLIWKLQHPPDAVTNPSNGTSWRKTGYASVYQDALTTFNGWHAAVKAAGIEPLPHGFNTRPVWVEKYTDWKVIDSIIRNRLNESGKARRITHEETKALAREVQKRNGAAREALMQAYYPFVVKNVRRAMNLNSDMDLKSHYEDLIRAGIYGSLSQGGTRPGGLMRAVELYDPSKDYKFMTYAWQWVKVGILKAIKDIRKHDVLSLQEEEFKDGSGEEIEGLIRDPSPGPEEMVTEDAPGFSYTELLDIMDRGGIDPHHQRIVMAYRGGMTQEDVGGEIGGRSGKPVTRQRIERIIARTWEKVRMSEGNRLGEERLPLLERLTNADKNIIGLILKGRERPDIMRSLGCGDSDIKRVYSILDADRPIRLLRKLIELGYEVELPKAGIDMFLTPKEEKILKLFLEGERIREIAPLIGVSAEDAASEIGYRGIKRIYEKWGLDRKDKYRINLFREAVRRGYITVSPALPDEKKYHYQKSKIKFNSRFENTNIPSSAARRSASGSDASNNKLSITSDFGSDEDEIDWNKIVSFYLHQCFNTDRDTFLAHMWSGHSFRMESRVNGKDYAVVIGEQYESLGHDPGPDEVDILDKGYISFRDYEEDLSRSFYYRVFRRGIIAAFCAEDQEVPGPTRHSASGAEEISGSDGRTSAHSRIASLSHGLSPKKDRTAIEELQKEVKWAGALLKNIIRPELLGRVSQPDEALSAESIETCRTKIAKMKQSFGVVVPPAKPDERLSASGAVQDGLFGVLGMTWDGEKPNKQDEYQYTYQKKINSGHNQSPSLFSSVATTNVAINMKDPMTNTPNRNDVPATNWPITSTANTNFPTSYKAFDSSKPCVLPNLTISPRISHEESLVKDAIDGARRSAPVRRSASGADQNGKSVCIELRKSGRPHDLLEIVRKLDDAYVIETIPHAPHSINVYKYLNSSTDMEMAYIDMSNWTFGVVIPVDHGIDIYTDLSMGCPLLIMKLVDNGKPYIFLSHIDAGRGIGKQVDKIINRLKDKNMTPTEIIFSPNTESKYERSRNALKAFLGREIKFIERKSDQSASALVTDKGWTIVSASGRRIIRKGIRSQLWQGVNSTEIAVTVSTESPSTISRFLYDLRGVTEQSLNDHPPRQDGKIVLSENLFIGENGDRGELDVLKEVTLKPLLESGVLSIVGLEDLRRIATNTDTERTSKGKVAVVMTEADYDNKIWNGSKGKSIRSSVLIVGNDTRLTASNYLYLESVIGLARAIMANNKPAIKRYYEILSGAPIDDDVLRLLDDEASEKDVPVKPGACTRPLESLERREKEVAEYIKARENTGEYGFKCYRANDGALVITCTDLIKACGIFSTRPSLKALDEFIDIPGSGNMIEILGMSMPETMRTFRGLRKIIADNLHDYKKLASLASGILNKPLADRGYLTGDPVMHNRQIYDRLKIAPLSRIVNAVFCSGKGILRSFVWSEDNSRRINARIAEEVANKAVERHIPLEHINMVIIDGIPFFKLRNGTLKTWAFDVGDAADVAKIFKIRVAADLVVQKDDIVCSVGELGGRFFDCGKAAGEINDRIKKENIGDKDTVEIKSGTGDEEISVTFVRKKRHNEYVWTFKERDLGKVAVIFGLRVMADVVKIEKDDVVCCTVYSENTLHNYFCESERLRSVILDAIAAANPGNKDRVAISGEKDPEIKVTFTRKPSGSQYLWTFKVADLYKIVLIFGALVRPSGVSGIVKGEIKCVSRILDRYFKQGQYLSSIILKKIKENNPGDKKNEVEIQGEGVSVRFFRRFEESKGLYVWVFHESDIENIGEIFVFTVRSKPTGAEKPPVKSARGDGAGDVAAAGVRRSVPVRRSASGDSTQKHEDGSGAAAKNDMQTEQGENSIELLNKTLKGFDNKVKIMVRLNEVAAIRAAHALIQVMGWSEDNVVIGYDTDIDEATAKQEFSGYDVEPFLIPWWGRMVNNCRVAIEFHDIPAIEAPHDPREAKRTITKVHGDHNRFSVSYYPFKYGLPVPVSNDEIIRMKKQLNAGARNIIVAGLYKDEELNSLMSAYNELYGSLPIEQRPLLILAAKSKQENLDRALTGNKKNVRSNSSTLLERMNSANVLVLNTSGELLSMYALADVCIVGFDRSTIEPASQGKIVLYFPGDSVNNRDATDRLRNNGAALKFSKDNLKMVLDNSEIYAAKGKAGLSVVSYFREKLIPDAAKVVASEVLPAVLRFDSVVRSISSSKTEDDKPDDVRRSASGAAQDKNTDFILALAIFDHGGPFALFDDFGLIYSAVYIGLGERFPELKKLGDGIKDSTNDYRNILLPFLEKKLDEKNPPIESIEKYQRWLYETKEYFERIIEAVEPLENLGEDEAISKEEALLLLKRYILNFTAIQVFLSEDTEKETEEMDLSEWLQSRDWRVKLRDKDSSLSTVNCDVNLKTDFGPITMKAPSALLHIAIERILSNGFDSMVKENYDINGEKPAISMRVGTVKGKNGEDKGSAQIVILNPGRVMEGKIEKNPETSLPYFFTLDYNRPRFSHAVGLPFVVRAIQKMGFKIDVRNINVSDVDVVEFVIELPLSGNVSRELARTPRAAPEPTPPEKPNTAALFDELKDNTTALRSMAGLQTIPAAKFDGADKKAFVLYADTILESDAMLPDEDLKPSVIVDIEELIRTTNIFDNTKVIIYGRKDSNGKLLNDILDKAAKEAGKTLDVMVVSSMDLPPEARFDEADELSTLIRYLRSQSENIGISNGSLLGVIKGPTRDEKGVIAESGKLKMPVVSFETGEGIYSLAEAVNKMLAIRNDTSSNKRWFDILKPIKKITEELIKAYEDYVRTIKELESRA